MLKSRNKLFCFSPPVMVATITIEVVLAIYTAWRYKLDDVIKLTLISLACLASFQLAEYHVCTGFGLTAETWSRFGFIMITALPPLGIHLMYKLAGKPTDSLIYGSYAIMAAFMIFFLTYRAAFIGHQCQGNYVIFQMGAKVGGAYGLYYYSLLATGIGIGVKWAGELKNKAKFVNQLQAVRGLIAGYFIFLVPTAITNTLTPASRQAIPSVMCGFAVLYALILVFYIVPKAAETKTLHWPTIRES